jgi:thiol-disulfide isomerase/thioredoxin
MAKPHDKNLIIALGAIGVLLAIILVVVLLKRKSPSSPPPERMAVQAAPSQPPAQPSPQPPANPPTLVLFYMDGCGHCTDFKPVWEQLVPELERGGVKCLGINYKDHMEMVRQEGIAGFPTIKFYPQGFPGKGIDYSGARTREGILDFLQNGPQ